MAALLKHMGIYHGCRHIFMAEQRLDGSYIRPFFKKMGCKTVAKRMGANFFSNSQLGYCIFNCFIDKARIYMVPPDMPAPGSKEPHSFQRQAR